MATPVSEAHTRTRATPWAELIGKQFGRLRVRAHAYTRWGCAYMRCDCSCGTKNLVVRATYLRTGHTVSCYCLGRELSRRRLQLQAGHQQPRGRLRLAATSRLRLSETNANRHLPEYTVWLQLTRRRPLASMIPAHWKKSFVAFYADVGAMPHPAAALVRTEATRSYSRENCQWQMPSPP